MKTMKLWRNIFVMTAAISLAFTVLFAPIKASAQLESVKELTMKSEYFNHERQVLIYTPGGYQQFDQTYYDVIYVFDAQCREMFDLVHCLLNMACKPDPDGGRSMSFIIVGICSPNLWRKASSNFTMVSLASGPSTDTVIQAFCGAANIKSPRML